MSLDDEAEQYCSHIVFYFPFENFPFIIYTHRTQSDDSKLTKKTSLTKSQCVQVNYYNFNEKFGRTLYLKNWKHVCIKYIIQNINVLL